jgi:hypothetical protein
MFSEGLALLDDGVRLLILPLASVVRSLVELRLEGFLLDVVVLGSHLCCSRRLVFPEKGRYFE